MTNPGENSTTPTMQGGGGGATGPSSAGRTTYRYHSDFAFGNVVHIDADTSVRAIVVAIAFYNDREMVLVSYMHNGGLQEPWLDAARLTHSSD